MVFLVEVIQKRSYHPAFYLQQDVLLIHGKSSEQLHLSLVDGNRSSSNGIE